MLELSFRPDRESPEPVYRQLEAFLRELIQTRRLPPGERLPASRELATSLGLGRNTVSQAYQALTEDGLQQVDSDPDLFITYHMTTQDNTVFSTTGFGYGGMGAGWGRWGGGMSMGSSTTTATTFTEGTLIVDAYGPDDKQMVWRGTGTVRLRTRSNT